VPLQALIVPFSLGEKRVITMISMNVFVLLVVMADVK
jgi:hypothetical protein